MNLNSDMDKKLTRLKKSRKYYKARVDEAAKKAMGSREWAKQKAITKLDEEEIRENKSKNDVMKSLAMQIEQTKEGSQEEQKLMKRMKRLRNAMYGN